jgi:hypothetical protein
VDGGYGGVLALVLLGYVVDADHVGPSFLFLHLLYHKFNQNQ